MINVFKKLPKIHKEILKLIYTTIVLFFVTIFLYFQFLKHQEYVKASPFDVILSNIHGGSVTISWKTQLDTPTYVRILPNEEVLGNPEVSKFHSITISNLKEQFPYQFVISDGKREWKRPHLKNSKQLYGFLNNSFSFTTGANLNKIYLPSVKEINVLPDELLYLTLYDKRNNEYMGTRSYMANKFGGVALDINSFDPTLSEDEYDIKILDYFSSDSIYTSLNPVYAFDINCNQSLPNQVIDGVTKEQFANFATRWVNGRGKNYAYECFNDVVYSSKMAGVDPAFSLAIWLNESAASNYTQNSRQIGYIEDFGIHGNPSVPPHNFKAQLNHFLSRNHINDCPGLNQWESWGNIYRYGTCNQKDPIQRQNGIDYYKRIESLYTWITNGRKLPSKVTNLPIPVDAGIDSGNWSGVANPLCCGLKYTNDDTFYGMYTDDAISKACNDIYIKGMSMEKGELEYAVEVENMKGVNCTKEYEGVCCRLPNDISWYPQSSCEYPLEGVSSSKDCIDYAQEKACFFRDYYFQWLPIHIGMDFVKDVTNQKDCISRNQVYEYDIQIKNGVNLISFDFNPSFNTDVLYASRLLNMYPQVSLIGSFSNNQWSNLIQRSESSPYVGQDFYFQHGKGYLVISTQDILVTLDGWEKEIYDSPKLTKGWNLVGGEIFLTARKSSKLITELKKEIENIQGVGVWSNELESLIYKYEDELPLYDDISLESNQAVFVKR